MSLYGAYFKKGTLDLRMHSIGFKVQNPQNSFCCFGSVELKALPIILAISAMHRSFKMAPWHKQKDVGDACTFVPHDRCMGRPMHEKTNPVMLGSRNFDGR